MRQRLQRLIDIQRLCLAFNLIERQLLLPAVPDRPDRAETDTEHSYSLAMAAWYLSQRVGGLDADKCLRYAMVHDLVELHAGDTFTYDKDQQAHDTKAERERQALRRLEAEWPDFPDMTDAIRAYEACQDRESRFVYALDKFMPMILNYLGDFRSYERHGIGLEDIRRAKATKVAVSPEIAELYEELIAIFATRPELARDKAV